MKKKNQRMAMYRRSVDLVAANKVQRKTLFREGRCQPKRVRLIRPARQECYARQRLGLLGNGKASRSRCFHRFRTSHVVERVKRGFRQSFNWASVAARTSGTGIAVVARVSRPRW